MNIFDRHHKKYDAWYDRNRFCYLSELEAIRKVLPKKGKGLEIGVGTGRFAAPLGITAGIDPSKNMIGMAGKRGVDARLGSGEALPYEGSSFDFVAIIITLCFVKDPRKVLEEAGRVLKKNGKIIIGIVDKYSFLGSFYLKKKSLFYKKANFLSVKETTGMLRTAGFDGFSYYQTIFRLPQEMDSIDDPKRDFGKGGFVVIAARKASTVI